MHLGEALQPFFYALIAMWKQLLLAWDDLESAWQLDSAELCNVTKKKEKRFIL